MKFALMLLIALCSEFTLAQQFRKNNQPRKQVVTFACEDVVCSQSRLFKKDKMVVISKMNRFRNYVAGGRYRSYPYCVNNMRKTVWSEALARIAQRDICKCHPGRQYLRNKVSGLIPQESETDKIPPFTRDYDRQYEYDPVNVNNEVCDIVRVVEKTPVFNNRSGLYDKAKNSIFNFILRGQMDDFWRKLDGSGVWKIIFRRAESTKVGCGYMLRHLEKGEKTEHLLAYLTCIYCSFNNSFPSTSGPPCTGCSIKSDLSNKWKKPRLIYDKLCTDDGNVSEYANIPADNNNQILCITGVPANTHSWKILSRKKYYIKNNHSRIRQNLDERKKPSETSGSRESNEEITDRSTTVEILNAEQEIEAEPSCPTQAPCPILTCPTFITRTCPTRVPCPTITCSKLMTCPTQSPCPTITCQPTTATKRTTTTTTTRRPIVTTSRKPTTQTTTRITSKPTAVITTIKTKPTTTSRHTTTVCPTFTPCSTLKCTTTKSATCPTQPSCPILTCPTFITRTCPTRPLCPTPTCSTFITRTCPTQSPCPTVTCETTRRICPTFTPCPTIVCPTMRRTTCPTFTCPSISCPTIRRTTCPTFTPCPTVTCRPTRTTTCPTFTPCPTIICRTTRRTTCPTFTPCPTVTCHTARRTTCPTFTPCPTITCRTTRKTTCATVTPCPTITCQITKRTTCPTFTPCPVVTCKTTARTAAISTTTTTTTPCPTITCSEVTTTCPTKPTCTTMTCPTITIICPTPPTCTTIRCEEITKIGPAKNIVTTASPTAAYRYEKTQTISTQNNTLIAPRTQSHLTLQTTVRDGASIKSYEALKSTSPELDVCMEETSENIPNNRINNDANLLVQDEENIPDSVREFVIHSLPKTASFSNLLNTKSHPSVIPLSIDRNISSKDLAKYNCTCIPPECLFMFCVLKDSVLQYQLKNVTEPIIKIIDNRR